jgi:hypothetical protein
MLALIIIAGRRRVDVWLLGTGNYPERLVKVPLRTRSAAFVLSPHPRARRPE